MDDKESPNPSPDPAEPTDELVQAADSLFEEDEPDESGDERPDGSETNQALYGKTMGSRDRQRKRKNV